MVGARSPSFPCFIFPFHSFILCLSCPQNQRYSGSVDVWGRFVLRAFFKLRMMMTQYDDNLWLIVCPHIYFFLRTLLIDRGVIRARVLVLDYLLLLSLCCSIFCIVGVVAPHPHTCRCFFRILNLFILILPFFHSCFLSIVTRCGLLCCCWELWCGVLLLSSLLVVVDLYSLYPLLFILSFPLLLLIPWSAPRHLFALI